MQPLETPAADEWLSSVLHRLGELDDSAALVALQTIQRAIEHRGPMPTLEPSHLEAITAMADAGDLTADAPRTPRGLRALTDLERMDLRLWYTQMASLAVNAISLATLFVIAVKFGRDATLPALAVAGANGGLTAAVLVVNLTFRRSWRRMRNEAASGEPLPPANDPGAGQ